MPNVILKKAEKALSFHGVVPKACVDEINSVISTTLTFAGNAVKPQFKIDDFGHFSVYMNYECHKHHEEDIIAVILDVMEKWGWTFRFEYDNHSASGRIAGDRSAFGGSVAPRELFIFQRAS